MITLYITQKTMTGNNPTLFYNIRYFILISSSPCTAHIASMTVCFLFSDKPA